ncbi:MAG: hypothetical protein HY554_07435, partial [Elusimicrobia bacterium]|nr:hypothetical protein [Elusimicrobiota bacterium]
MPPGLRLLLLERPDPDRLFGAGVSTQTSDLTELLKTIRPLELTPARWQRMRDDYEAGRLPSDEDEEELAPLPPSELLVSTAAPA